MTMIEAYFILWKHYNKNKNKLQKLNGQCFLSKEEERELLGLYMLV
jgi:hypothetical protein